MGSLKKISRLENKETNSYELFTIDTDNNIVVYASADDAPTNDQLTRFSSEKELARAAQQWPAERPAEIWNSFAGGTPFDELRSEEHTSEIQYTYVISY